MKSIFLALTSLLLSACFSESFAVKPIDETTAIREKEIFVVSHGWHTGFIIPAQQIQAQLPKLKERFGDTPYIEFGWGDKEFYQAEEATIGLTLSAIMWPTESVIHAVAVPKKASEYFPNSQIIKLCLSSSEYLSLINFIANSFRKNKKDEILPLGIGIYGNSQFYKATGDFSLTNTCNKWTANGLQSTGMDISTTFKLTADSVMAYLAEHKQNQPIAAPCR
jgi:uncharacterized protein (TIGR02117 family)